MGELVVTYADTVGKYLACARSKQAWIDWYKSDIKNDTKIAPSKWK